MIYSKYAIDYSKGFIKHEDGTLHPNKIGCWILTSKECKEILDRRK